MESLFFSNLTSPPLLFFLLGVFAVVIRSDLDIPDQVAKFLSLYLLFAIGFKGGVAIAESELSGVVVRDLLLATALSALIPFYVFFLVKRQFGAANAAATAATYGSISAVTFVTAISYLDAGEIEWSGYMVAAMALMESPAIIVGLLLYYRSQTSSQETSGATMAEMIHESLSNGSVLLIVGSLVIGWISGPDGLAQVDLLVKDLFIGVLCLFLLDMGIVAARRLQDLSSSEVKVSMLLLWGLVLPIVNASVALVLVAGFNIPEGNALLLVVLAASGSYIAVPAAMRLALPQASPSVYLPMSLAISFPFNLLIGIPLYHQLINWLT
ncbi:MAG: sodium-dependent bicarbonate transport family permease [Pseudomonadales bacterium]